MERLKYRRPFYVLAVIFLLWGAAEIIPNPYVVGILFMTSVFATGAVLWSYGPIAWRALWREDYATADQIAIGMILTAGGFLGVEVLGLAARAMGVPAGLNMSGLTKVFFAMIVIGFLFKRYAASQEAMPEAGFMRMARAVFVVMALGIISGVGLVIYAAATGAFIPVPPAGARITPPPQEFPNLGGSPDEQET